MANETPTTTSDQVPKSKALSLNSGGLDSQLAICVLRDQGIHVEAITFASPFFSPDTAIKAADALNVKIHVIDFTDDLVALIKDPPHGLGSCMNPCIDCHATMIRRAAEKMEELGFDFIATGEVLGQRPMSQQRQSMMTVHKSSGIGDRLVRPLSAQLLPETEPERLGLVDRSKLLNLSGRGRKPQFELAKHYKLKDYPSPAGGCKLTEPNYSRRLKNLQEHEGLDDTRLIKLLSFGRHLRLPSGTLVFSGRNKADNNEIRQSMRGGDVLFRSVNVPGSTVLAIKPKEDDLPTIRRICAAFSDQKGIDTVTVSEMHPATKPVEYPIPVCSRDEFSEFIL